MIHSYLRPVGRALATLAVAIGVHGLILHGPVLAASYNIGDQQTVATGDITNNYTFVDGTNKLLMENNARLTGNITLDRDATIRVLPDTPGGTSCAAEILFGNLNMLSLDGHTLTVEYAPNSAYVPMLRLNDGGIFDSGNIVSTGGEIVFGENFDLSPGNINVSAWGISIACQETMLFNATFTISDHVILSDAYDYAKDFNVDANTSTITFFANPSGTGAHPFEISYTGEFNFLNTGEGADFGRAIGFAAPQALPLGQTTMAYYIGPETFNKTDSICVMGGIPGDTNPFVYGTLKIDSLDDLKNDDGNYVQLGFAGGKLDMTNVGTTVDFTTGSGIGIMTFEVPGYPGSSIFVLADDTTITLAADKLLLDNGLLEVEGDNLTVKVDCGGDEIDPEKFGGFRLPADATLQFINVDGVDTVNSGNLEGSGTVEAGGKTLALGSDFQGDTDTGFTGTIDSAVGFEKVGAGTSLIGSGATAAITGNGSVTEGTLAVNATGFSLNGGAGTMTVSGSGELGGSIMTGNVLLASGGTLGPGMSIGYHKTDGNLTLNSGGILEIETEPLAAGITVATPGKNHDNDIEHVTGNVTFQSGSQIVLTKDADSVSANPYKIGDKYKVLVAEGSVSGLSNTRIGIDSSMGSFSAQYQLVNETGTYYDSAGAMQSLLGNWLIVELRPGFQPVSPNERAVNQYIQSAPGPAAANIRTQLNGLTQQEQQLAINELSGQAVGTATSSAVQNSSSAMHTLTDNIRPGMGNGVGSGMGGSFAQRRANTTTVLAQNGCCDYGWTSWARGYGLGGSIFADENTASTTVAVGGLVVGLEKRDMDNKLGLFYTYGGANSRVDTLGSSVQTNHHLWGAYAVHQRCWDYFLLSGGAGADFYDSRRVNRIGAIQELALDNYTGWQALAYGEYGLTLDARLATLQPFFGLQYIHLRVGEHEEDLTLAPNTANYYDAMDYDSLRSDLGIRAKRPFAFRDFVGNVELRSTWIHELLKETAPIYGAGLAASSGGYIVQGADMGRDWCVLGTGVRWNLNERTQCFLDYDLNFNARQTLHTGSGGLAFQF